MEGVGGLAAFLNYAAIFVFAASGALAAARRGHDIVTFCFFAGATGLIKLDGDNERAVQDYLNAVVRDGKVVGL